MMRKTLLSAVTALVLAPGSAWAAPIWVEVGDAGDLLGTAQTVTLAGFDEISGTVSTSGDADLYAFLITSPATFSATTVGTVGTLTDTQLFLFDAAGMGIATNDDTATFRSTLPAGNALYASLLPGLYYLAISGFNTDPVSPGGLIFPIDFGGVNGPTGPGGGSALSGWDGGSSTGTYNIQLTSVDAVAAVAAVPEPATLILFGSGLLGVAARRRLKVKK